MKLFWKTVFDNALQIALVTHPDYDANVASWQKFRVTFEGGDKFISDFLETFSVRETYTDYYKRRRITYCPAHAKSAILEIKNAIYQRMVDITRSGGTDSYRAAVQGEDLGVDLAGSTMNSFIGSVILPDLLSIGKVGVYIDREPLEDLRKDNVSRRPYLYKYNAEAIKSWKYCQNKLVNVLLEDTIDVCDEVTGLITGTATEYRQLTLTPEGVHVIIYDSKNEVILDTVLKLKTIPFVIFEISQSLLTDVANYQIALLNLASSDINYALKANFPFYTEQYDAIAEMVNTRQAMTDPQVLDNNYVTGNNGEAGQAGQAKNKEVTVGVTQGRRYPKGLDRPGFISPSSEPLTASMEKQEQLKKETRQLVHLSLQNVTSKTMSAESKNVDEHGLESGLSNIGLELEFGERSIAEVWSEYEGQKKSVVVIKYPSSYSLRTDDDRRREAKELREELSSSPSKSYQKELSKMIATITIGHKVSADTLKKIHKEIDDAELIVANAKEIIEDHKEGLVSTNTASLIRGYPVGEAEKAKKDRAERAASIVAAQAKAGDLKNPASRGVADLDDDPNSGKDEKTISADKTMHADMADRQRGDGK